MGNRVGSATSKGTVDALPADDLFLCLRPILAVGKLVISVPLGGIFRLNEDKLPVFTFWKSIAVVLFTMLITVRCLVSIIVLGLNIVLKTSGFFDLFRRVALMVIGNACYINMVWKAPMLCKLFAHWRETYTIPWSSGQQSNVKRKITAIAVLLFCTLFVENWINTFGGVTNRRESAGSNNLTFFAALVETDEFMISTALPEYSWIVGLVLFIMDKLTLYQSSIAAIISISLTIAVESKLEDLISRIKTPPVNWGAARQDFLSIMKIIDMVNDIVSVFLLQMLTINLVFTTYLIYSAVKPDKKSLQDGIYTILALMYLFMRFFFLCVPAGNIYRASQRIWTIVQQSPDREHDSEAENLERLVTQPVGITCMGLFTITHSFILCFVNAVFTLLIVMLQAGKKDSKSP